MANIYEPVYFNNQGNFNNPRQKMWAVWKYSRGEYSSGWSLVNTTNCFIEAKNIANDLLRGKTMLQDIIVCELVPIDSIITPSV